MKISLKDYLKIGVLLFGVAVLLWRCESENVTSDQGQPHTVETVTINEALALFTAKPASNSAKTAGEAYIIPHLLHITQEEIINSDVFLTVIPATTIYEEYYSRILLLKINDKIQSLVFGMYASGSDTPYFSGEILITDLQGNFLNGYRVENGRFVSQFRKKAGSKSEAAKTGNVVCPEHGECNGESGCILCLQELDEVEVVGESGGSGDTIEVYPGLNDFPDMEGGDGGPDMGMDWDYGPGEGMAPQDDEENVEEQVVIDTTFADNPCLMAVYNSMGGSVTFQNYLKNFDGNFSVADLRFSANDNFSTDPEIEPQYHNAMAITMPPLASNLINITFNTDTATTGNILKEPDVFKAVAMIHEILHAEMYRKMLDAVKTAEINQNNLNWRDWPNNTDFGDFIEALENKYFGIFDYYTRYDWDTSTPNNAQHQAMAQHYRDIIKQALTGYDPTLTEVQKDALSWLGLNSANIVAWQNLTPEERTAINDLQTQIRNTFPNGCN